MKRRPSLAAVLLLAGCAHGRPVAVAPAPASPPSPQAAGVRYFHAVPEESFWVSRAPDLDRVIAGGARLELGPGGEVRAAAWDTALASGGDRLLGALAVPERLGGGFLVWTRTRVFSARTFAGPLAPVALGVPGEVAVRGARAGLSSVIVVTEGGPRGWLPGAARLTPLPEPALLDLVALSAQRAARLDVFGRQLVAQGAGDGSRGSRRGELRKRSSWVGSAEVRVLC